MGKQHKKSPKHQEYEKLSTTATNAEGDVVNLPEEFAQKAQRGFPLPNKSIKSS